VVGGGPAGLACAIRLLERGAAVHLLTPGDRLGGVPDATIPADRYEDAVPEAEAILAPARKAGRLVLETGRELGPDLTLRDLRARFPAVFLATGLPGSVSLGRAEGVTDALTFLAQAKRGERPTMDGARVVVLGGGNTAMDAACTAARLGARDVCVVYRRSFVEMPAWPAERDRALRDGVHLLILTQPLDYVANATGRLTGVRVARTELGAPDASGRRRPQPLPGTEAVLPADVAIEALGQAVPGRLRVALQELPFTPGGLVETLPGSQATRLPGVFAGGDLANGGTTVVQAVAEGMRAAEEIVRSLAPGDATT
jgi:NADPH-dependent glutamate synthase beta subunit-like oxidoreductase